MTNVAVIPARGGSKGIPRKCIRPLAGRPLIAYAIEACRQSSGIERVVVSTEDDEIAMLSERFGADVIMRPAALADDVTPLDPVIAHAVDEAERRFGERYGIVVTVQPTAPLVTAADVGRALALFDVRPGPDTVISVVEDRHLTWSLADGRPVPDYRARVNRQLLEPRFRETGAIIACRRDQLRSGTRIGANIELLQMPASRSVDIDTYTDLFVCESILSRRRVVIAVAGYPAIGLGHAYRAILLAHELVHFDIQFVCEARSELAASTIRQYNYEVVTCPDGELLATILALKPHLVINDLLDTDADYVRHLKAANCRVVNFEDLGPGADHADLVVNALYDPDPARPGHLAGADYFCLRDEFVYRAESAARTSVERILVTFGGVDENNLTLRSIDALVPVCRPRGIALDVVVGPGFRYHAQVQAALQRHDYPGLRIAAATSRISDYMMAADVAVTSGGRTVLELAALRVPMVVVCQNARELTHSFANAENGVVNLGIHSAVAQIEIAAAVQRLIEDSEARNGLRAKLSLHDLSGGKRRVAKAIVALFEDS